MCLNPELLSKDYPQFLSFVEAQFQECLPKKNTAQLHNNRKEHHKRLPLPRPSSRLSPVDFLPKKQLHHKRLPVRPPRLELEERAYEHHV